MLMFLLCLFGFPLAPEPFAPWTERELILSEENLATFKGDADEIFPLDLLNSLPYLDGLQLLVDYPQRRLAVVEGERYFEISGYQTPKWASLPLHFEDQRAYFEIEFNGQKMRALIDSSCSSIIVRSHEPIKSGDIAIEGEWMGHYDVVAIDFCRPPVDIILGAPFLARRPILFDLIHQRILFGKELVD